MTPVGVTVPAGPSICSPLKPERFSAATGAFSGNAPSGFDLTPRKPNGQLRSTSNIFESRIVSTSKNSRRLPEHRALRLSGMGGARGAGLANSRLTRTNPASAWNAGGSRVLVVHADATIPGAGVDTRKARSTHPDSLQTEDVISGWPNTLEASTSSHRALEPDPASAELPGTSGRNSKSLEQHLNQLALSILYYNWVRIHGTIQTTPAGRRGSRDASVVGLLDHRARGDVPRECGRCSSPSRGRTGSATFRPLIWIAEQMDTAPGSGPTPPIV